MHIAQLTHLPNHSRNRTNPSKRGTPHTMSLPGSSNHIIYLIKPIFGIGHLLSENINQMLPDESPNDLDVCPRTTFGGKREPLMLPIIHSSLRCQLLASFSMSRSCSLFCQKFIFHWICKMYQV